jgi:hypothetical protein
MSPHTQRWPRNDHRVPSAPAIHPYRRAWASGLVVLAMVFGGALSACGASVIANPGTANCYESLPVAIQALHAPTRHYHFVGIRRVAGSVILKHFPEAPVAPKQTVCAFAFTGTFASGQVTGARPGESGHAALVVTTTKQRLIGSVVMAKLPQRFSHLVHP